MAEKATVARPYARAAFEYARDKGEFAGWSRLLAVGGAVAADATVLPLIGNPKVPVAKLVELIAQIAGASGVQMDVPGRNFLAVLAQNNRLTLLPEIAAQYERLRAETENAVDVEVVSALPLAQPQRDALVAALTKRFARQVRLRESIDESLIGGALIRAGDLVIDGSLKGRLERLTHQMTAQ